MINIILIILILILLIKDIRTSIQNKKLKRKVFLRESVIKIQDILLKELQEILKENKNVKNNSKKTK